MHKLTVKLGKRSYPIFVGARLEGIGKYLKNKGFSRNLLVVTDKNVAPLYLKRLAKSLSASGFAVSSLALAAGESHKNIAAVASIYRASVKAKLDRKSLIIALGGGVVGDLAGFAAATYLRGLAFVQVPTTLLAMVDSSVGGKTGFDLKEGKNLVGAFLQPKAVWIDISTLKTLPASHMRNGLGEVIKYGIMSDPVFFEYLNKNISKLSDKNLAEIVGRSCRIKAGIVEKDEFETKGLREALNLGHTFGHALETLSGYKGLLHGEAVAAGIAMAAQLSVNLDLLDPCEEDKIRAALMRAGLGMKAFRKIRPAAMLAVMMRDKKVRNGKLRLVLPLKIGKVAVVEGVPLDMIKEILK